MGLFYLIVRKGKDTSAATHGTRHQRKHKSELISLENVIRDVMRDQTLLHKRLVKLERKFVVGSRSTERRDGGGTKAERGSSWNSADYNSNQVSNEIDIIDGAEQHQQGVVSRSQTKIKRMDQRKRKSYDYDEDVGHSLGNQASNSYRINILEKDLKDYSNTLQGLSFKLSSVMDIRESSKQLFTAMEGLETKYDERLTEMQTGLARLEASVSQASITNDELKEQQIRI
ncbi:unnamed protein product [Allacma fusca]|uniref:Uncharacterized protein n=1 Tax=Allacma fusca TaxID=39272 RepID=A0A8J2KRR2_9HEXA|nr:unnamed protein product [Allacma fusca]